MSQIITLDSNRRLFKQWMFKFLNDFILKSSGGIRKLEKQAGIFSAENVVKTVYLSLYLICLFVGLFFDGRFNFLMK